MMENGQETASLPETPNTGEIFSKKNLLFAAIVLTLAGALFFFMQERHNRPLINKDAKPQTLASVPVTKVIEKTLFRDDQLPGEIDAYQDVLIYPKVPGFVKWLGVDRGSLVEKGELMARMYAPEYLARRQESIAKVAAKKAELAAEESRLEDLKAELQKRRATLLADQSTFQRVYTASLVPGVIADNDVVQWSQTVEEDRQEINSFIKRVNAKNHQVQMKREEVDSMSKAFENFADFASYLEIVAPFNGYVTERKLHVGSFVGPDGTGAYPPICRLKQLDLLRIISPVPEELVSGIILGSKVDFTVSSFPGRRFTGTVARISNSLDKETRTMPVELNYLNPEFEILPGMFCKVYWPTRRRSESLFVPISSVVSTPLNTFVCKIDNDRIEWVDVRKGETMGDMVEVFGKLSKGDSVALQGSEELENQSKVKPEISAVKNKEK
ncbi:MAG: efflux RND transporter periplasmic adaptor subunit [Candidatus Obscuribacterales bacterium]|nr:efflux RND transporter periplasmic adaptor subunit [Candidatus Obscuribacterales bacterium]